MIEEIKSIVFFIAGLIGIFILILFFFGILFGIIYYISTLVIVFTGLNYIYLSDVVILLWILTMLGIIVGGGYYR